MIEQAAASCSASIIDVGGGESTLVDDLLARGYDTITVLDISQTAVDANRKRLGKTSDRVCRVVADITRVELEPCVCDVWHDSAVFHFLTSPRDRLAYVRLVSRAAARVFPWDRVSCRLLEPNNRRDLSLPACFFATDLHGKTDRYNKLLASIIRHRPAAVFLGGDLLPRSALSAIQFGQEDFVHDYLLPTFTRTRDALGAHYPDIFLILGNDDPRRYEEDFVAAAGDGLWHYVHAQKSLFGDFAIYGLAYVPPTPFLLKDWERYDVSRYVPPGCVSPEEGSRTVPTEERETKWATIQKDLASLVGEDPLHRAVLLLHTPPCDTPLDRAALDGRTYEHIPLDLHVGSIAVKRFIEERQPLLTLHGHIHESARLSGEWKFQIGRTVCINGAHDGPELALVRFDLESPEAATRDLL